MNRAHRALRSLLQSRLSKAALYVPSNPASNTINFDTGQSSVDYTITFPQVTLLTAAESRRIFKAANPNKTIGFIVTKERVLIIESKNISDTDIFFVQGERYDVVEVDATSYTGYSICKVKHTKGSNIFTTQLTDLIDRGWVGSHQTQVHLDWLIRAITSEVGDDWSGFTVWPMVGTTLEDSLYRLSPQDIQPALGSDYKEYGRGGGYPHVLPTDNEALATIFLQFNELMGRS